MQRLLRTLHIDPEHASPLFWLSFRALLVSLVTVTGQSYQSALFLGRFSASLLPWQYAAMAAVSIAVTAPYGRLQRRFGELNADRILFGILGAGMLVGFVSPDLLTVGPVLFVFTLWVQLVGFFGNVGLWDAAVRAFPSRVSRTLLPMVAAGATLGCVLGGQLTRWVASLSGNNAILPVLLLGAVVTAVLAGRPSLERPGGTTKSSGSESLWTDAGRVMKENRLARYVTWLVLLSMPVFLAVDFAFKKVLKAHYGVDEMSAFMGDYYFYLNLVVLGMQLFVMAPLMRRLGVRAISLTTPALIALALVVLAVAPGLAAALGLAVVAGAMKFTFFQNSRNQLFTPLSPRNKAVASMLNRSVVNPVGSVLAGLLLIPVKDASVSVLASISLAGTAALGFVAFKAASAYGDELRGALKRRILDAGTGYRGAGALDATALAALRNRLTGESHSDRVFAAALMARERGLSPEELAELLRESPDRFLPPLLELARSLTTRGRVTLLIHLLRAQVAAGRWEPIALLLESEGERASRMALEALSSCGFEVPPLLDRTFRMASSEAVPREELLALLSSLNSTHEVSSLAVRAACLLPNGGGWGVLLRWYHDGDDALRSTVLRFSGEARIPGFTDLCRTALEVSSQRSAALEGAQSAGVLPTLRPLFLGWRVHPQVAPGLTAALARCRTPECVDALRENLKSDRGWLWFLTLKSLESGGPPPALELSTKLEDRLRERLDNLQSALRCVDRPWVRTQLAAEAAFVRQALFVLFRLKNSTRSKQWREVEETLFLNDTHRRNAALELLEGLCKGGREWFVGSVELAGMECNAASTAQTVIRSGDPVVDATQAALGFGGMTMTQEHWDPALVLRAMMLRQCGFFESLATEMLLDIASRGEEVSLEGGEVLCREGDPGDGLYFILEGELDISIQGRILNRLVPGNVMGEIALLDKGPRTATVVAVGHVDMLRFTPELFEEILSDYPDVGRGVIRTLVGHVRRQSGPAAGPSQRVGGQS